MEISEPYSGFKRFMYALGAGIGTAMATYGVMLSKIPKQLSDPADYQFYTDMLNQGIPITAAAFGAAAFIYTRMFQELIDFSRKSNWNAMHQ